MIDLEEDRSRAEIAQRGRQLRERLGLAQHLHDSPAHGWLALSDELLFGTIWDRPGLELDDRMAAVLPVLSALGHQQLIEPYAAAALRVGLEPLAVQELFIQAGLYAGFATAELSLRLCAQTLAGAQPPSEQDASAAGTTIASLHGAGEAKMAQLHGARATAGYADPAHQTTAALYQVAFRYGYGELWNRPGLSVRQRFICAVATFAALEMESQLLKFSRSALEHGLSREQSIEVVMQIAPYAGFPRALNALAAM